VFDTIRGMYTGWSWAWVVPLLVLAGVGLYWRRRGPTERRLVMFTVVSLVGLAAVASVFMFGWQGYVPRRTGASRVVLEASLLVPPFVAIGVAALAREAASRPRARRLRNEQTTMIAALTIAAVFGAVAMFAIRSYNAGQAPSRDELAIWRSLPLTSHDVVLTNAYTEGFIADVTGAQGLLDGRAPYTFGDLLHRANRLLRGAAAFYDDPAAHCDFIFENHVTWVVVGNPDAESLGTRNVWATPANLTALDRSSDLRRVVATPTLTVYRVIDPANGCTHFVD
jgi:hypothetical protein